MTRSWLINCSKRNLGGDDVVKIGKVELKPFHLVALCIAVGFIVYGIVGFISERRQSDGYELSAEQEQIQPTAAVLAPTLPPSTGSGEATIILAGL